MTLEPNDQMNELEEEPLRGWKMIAAHLGRDVSTVRRWESIERLPVRRHRHLERSSVFAYPSELDSWKENRKPPEAMPAWQRPARAMAMSVVLLLSLAIAGSEPLISDATGDEPESAMTVREFWTGPEVQVLGNISPDGRFLSSVDMRGTGNLIIRDIAAGTDRTLTDKTGWGSNEYAYRSHFSPDGKQVAYTWFSMEQHPDGNLTYELRTINSDGSGMRRLYRNQETAYVQPHGWTPDGRWILALLQTTPPNTYQIALISTEDGSVRILKSLGWRRPRNMTLSPDGRSIVYDFPPNEELGQRDIYMLATNGSREVSIVEHGANDSNPIWTPAGDAILFTSDRTGSLGLWRQPMREEGRDGAPTLVKPNVGAIIPMGFTPEGALYYGLEVGQNDIYMATLTVTADDYLSPPMPIIETYMGHNTVPDFSPDGEYLSYISQRGQATRGPQAKVLVIRSLSTGEEHELQTELNISTQIAVPRWSPDSRSLVTLGQGRDGRFDFYQIDAETGAHKMLVDSPGDGANQRMPILLPGGKSLIHERKLTYDDPDMGLIIQDLETGDERTLFRARHLHAWTLSPDGQQVAVSVSAEGPQEEVELAEGRTISLPEGGFLLLVLPVDGSEATEIIRTPQREEVTGLAWTADSRYVFYIQQTILSQLEDRADDESAPVWRIPASGGEPMLTELRFRPDEILSLRPHPDGRRLVYASGHSEAQPKREIWVQENFLPR